ncbi:hypothetical protein FB45DRAFT_842921 [Roridomyces roridus]|uniref:BTB domain-containing protein n=1 Tax=Roridomyces roridus TaxID=1738132 RepID=A0AAD7FD24_9AGAR|nr:hypothetical protein FB45DRAFT_842921 [Roridomyces roridus]
MATVPDNCHASFADKTADVALHSVEGTVYLVHSIILRNTSSFFRTMLSLPQPADSKAPHDIPVGEKDVVLERVLRLMCGMEIPRWSSLDEIESVLTLVEKWEAPGPLSVVRTAVTSTHFADEPLRLYVLTSHFGWEEESKQVLTETLKLMLLSGEHDSLLCRLSSRSLLKIVTFHDRCKTRFRDALNGGELFSAGNEEPRICGCGKRTDNTTWRALKAKLLTEFEKRPLGDQILVDMSAWPEAAACWREKCGCGTQYYDQVATVRNIKESITNSINLSLAG